MGRRSRGRAVAIVAQLVRASVCGTEGRGFKSPRSPHHSSILPDRQREMTTPWGLPDFDAHEEVHFVTDDKCGLRAIIAVHSTHLGPAAGEGLLQRLVDIIELNDHPFFVASQFHPEFNSRPNRPEPLFREYVGAAAELARERGAGVESAEEFEGPRVRRA